MINCILIRYGELHLKGLNRPYFEKKLFDSIVNALEGVNCSVVKVAGRFIVRGFETDLADAIAERTRKVFGIVSVSPAVECEKDFDIIASVADKLVKTETPLKKTFKVRARRSDKRFFMTSEDICRELGAALINSTGLAVDVHNPDIMVNVEIRERAYVYTNTLAASGGMPAGSAGKAVLLLSGGIDSPVAGYMTAKRGANLECLYFHSFPFTSERAKQKVVDITRKLSEYCGEIQLHISPFTEIQSLILEKGREDYITVLLRRMMMRIANFFAQKTGAEALVTGESLGQVASQTMKSIACVDVLAEFPVFRPVIGFDKIEITNLAKKIGTYDISILPYQDCCSVFVPKHPVTRPEINNIEKQESFMKYDQLIEDAVKNAETYCFNAGKQCE